MSDADAEPTLETPSETPPFKERLIRWLPTLVGLALAGVGFGAAGFASSNLKVTVEPPKEVSSEEDVDPLVLLQDDVSIVQGDLNNLSEGMGTNMEALATHIDTEADAREDRLKQRIVRLDRRVKRLEQTLERMSKELAQRPVAARPRARDPVAKTTDPIAKKSDPVVKKPDPIDEDPDPIDEEPKPRPKRKRGLFKFKLKGGLDFAQRLRFKLIPSLSRVGFDAKSTLHDFSGVTSKVGGSMKARLAKADEDFVAEITAQAKTLKTGIDDRDTEMRKQLDTEHHPEITFELTSFKTDQVDVQKKTLSGEARGKMTIHGVTRELRVPVEMSVDRGRRLLVKGELKIKMSEFGIEVPSQAGGAIEVEDEIKIWLSLRFRSLGKA